MSSQADISNLEIEKSKINADGKSYFKLFEKHVPRDLGPRAAVCLYKLDNFSCMHRIIQLNPEAKYIVVGARDVHKNLKNMLPAAHIEYSEDTLFEKMPMTFDCIIMNPPYQRNLHTKILAEIIKHLAPTGKIVSLQPVDRWQKALLFGSEKPVAGTIVLERFSMDESYKLFRTDQRSDLGIVSNTGDECVLVNNCRLLQKMRRRLLEAVEIGGLLKDKLETSFKDFPVAFGWAIPIVPRGDLSKRDTGCYLIVNKRPFRKENIGHHRWYNASSEHEQKLVGALYKNVCLRYVVKGLGINEIPYKILPWIDGFKKDGNLPLTFKEMCDWFGLTNEEVEIVKKEMNLYLNDEDLMEVMAKYK